MSREKQEYVKQLNQFLMVQVSWELLPEGQLRTLVEAFQRLKADVDEIFMMFDEVLNARSAGPLTVEDSKKERSYVV